MKKISRFENAEHGYQRRSRNEKHSCGIAASSRIPRPILAAAGTLARPGGIREGRRHPFAARCAYGNEIWRVYSAVTLGAVAMPNSGYTVLSPLAAKPM